MAGPSTSCPALRRRGARAPGEDPFLGAAMARAQVRGFQGPVIGTPGRIIAGPKHYMGYVAADGGVRASAEAL